MFKDLIRKRLLSVVVAAAAGALVTILHEKLNLPLEAAQGLVEQIAMVVIVYVLGQSATDAAAILKGTKQN
jgi:hypothetical protein